MKEQGSPPRPPAKPSQAPSWAMLGFALGALFILALPRRHAEPQARPARPRPPPTSLTPPRITTVEAVFAQWGSYAVWDHDLTQLALWNSDTGSYSDCFEAVKFDDGIYFRSIPRLTRPVLTHGVNPNSPLEFTETEEQRREWLKASAEENWRAVGEALHPNPSPSK